MKKVKKSFMRTLSVILVAAMVTTLTPEVALTTYAAEETETEEVEQEVEEQKEESAVEENNDTEDVKNDVVEDNKEDVQEGDADSKGEGSDEKSDEDTPSSEVITTEEISKEGEEGTSSEVETTEETDDVVLFEGEGTFNVTPTWDEENTNITGVKYAIDSGAPQDAAQGANIPVTANSTVTFTITVNEGFKVQVKEGEAAPQDCTGSGTVYTYTIDSVTEAKTVAFTAVSTAPAVTEYTVTYTDPGENAHFTFAAGNPEKVAKDQDLTFGVKPDEGYDLSVEVKVGQTPLTAEKVNAAEANEEGVIVYTIAKENITDNVTITVTATEKTYKATVTKTGDDGNTVITKIEYTTTKDATKKAYTEAFDVVKNAGIKLYLTEAEVAASTRQEVVVKVGDTVIEKDEKDNSYSIPNEEGAVTVTVECKVVTLKDVTVNCGKTTVTYTGDLKATPVAIEKLGEAEDAKSGLKGVDVGKEYYLFITPSAGKSITLVQYGSEKISPVNTEKGKAYQITIKDTADEVTIVEDNSYSVTVEKDDHVTVKYAEKDIAYSGNEKEFSDISGKIDTASAIYLYAAPDENYQIAGVDITTVFAKADANDEYVKDSLSLNGNDLYKIAPEKEGYTVKSISVKVRVQRITHEFTFVSHESANIVCATGTILAATSGAVKASVYVNQGEKLEFEVKVANDNYDPETTVAHAYADQGLSGKGEVVDVRVTGDKEVFYIDVTGTPTNKYIQATATEFKTGAITITTDRADIAKLLVKVDGNEETEKTVTANSFSTDALKAGAVVMFKPVFAEDTNYEIESVKIGENILTADKDGYYTVTADGTSIAVAIKTQLNAKKARTIKVVAPEGVQVSFTDGTSQNMEAGDSYVTLTKTELPFTVTAPAGYDVDKVTVGEDVLEARYKLAAVTEYGTTQTITVTIKNKAATADKYFKIVNGDNYGINVDEQEGIELVEGTEDTYVIKKDTAADLELKIWVNYKQKITGFTQSIDGLKAGEVKLENTGIDRVWRYTYSINSYSLQAGTKEAPTEIKPVLEDYAIRITVTGGPVVSIKQNGSIIWTPYYAEIGETVIVEAMAGDSLFIQNGDEETQVTLDSLHKYKFVATEDITFVVKPAEKDEFIITQDNTEADYVNDNKVDITIAKSSDPGTKLPIYAAEFVNEDAKSKITIADDKETATVTIDEGDAGKTLEVVLSYEEYNNTTGRRKVVEAGVATIKVAPIVSAITVKGIKNNATIKLNAGSTVEYPVTFKQTGVSTDLLKVSATVDGKPAETSVSFNSFGELVIEAPEKAENAIVEIGTNTKESTKLLTFKVNTTLPVPKVSKVESPIQGYDNLIVKVTADKAVNAVDYDNNLYYMITVTAKEPNESKKEVKPAGTIDKQFIIVPYDSEIIADIKVIDKVDKTKDTAWKFDVSAKLVLVKDGKTIETDKEIPEDKIVNAGAAVTKTFSTRNAYYEDKLGVTKKTTTIYNGQSDVLAGIVKFSNKASYITNVSALAYNLDGTIKNGISVDIDETTGEVTVDVNQTVNPGKYNLVLSADAYKEKISEVDTQTMYRATATLPITVVPGIDSISVSAPKQITVTDKKDASITVKPVGYSWSGVKAKTQKFTYEVSVCNRANTDLEKAITVKNNVVKIAKGYKVKNDPEDNMFAITVTANDYAGNLYNKSLFVEVTNENLVLSKVQLVDDNGTPCKTTLSASEAQGLRLLILDNHNEVVDPDLVTIKPSNAKAVTIYSAIENGVKLNRINLLKAAKNVTFTVTTKDGGNKKAVSAKYTFTYDTVEKITATWKVATQPVLVETAENTYEYKGNYNNVIRFNVSAKLKDDAEIPGLGEPYQNFKVTAKGGKATLNGKTLSVTPNAEKTEVTIKDATGKKTLTIKLTDKAFVKTAAPSMKQMTKLYADKFTSGGAVESQTLILKANGKQKYAYVQLIPESDSAMNNDIRGIHRISYYQQVLSDPNDYYDSNAGLEVDSQLKAGNYKFTAIYGRMDTNNQFIAQTKPATITIKVDKLPAYKPVTSYTIDPLVSKSVTLKGNTNLVDVSFSDLQNANVKGQPNKFREYFDLVGNTLSLKSSLTDEQIVALSKDKDNLTGYVTYKYAIASGQVTKQAKITVKINAKAVKYTATPINVLSLDSITGYTSVYAGKTRYSVAGAKVVSGTEGWTATVSDRDSRDIMLTASSQKAGKVNVDVYIVSGNSENIKDATTPDKIKELGNKVTVTVNIYDKDTYAKKISAPGSKYLTYDLTNENYNRFGYSYWGDSYRTITWNDTAKTVQWTLPNNRSINGKSYYSFRPYTMNVQNDTIKGVAIKGEAPKGVSVRFVDSSNWYIEVSKNDVEQNKTLTVPVKITFTNGAVPETITYKIKTPKALPSIDDVAETVEQYVLGYVTTSANKNTDIARAETEANNALAGIFSDVKVKSVTGEEVKAEDNVTVLTTKVTITLQSKVDESITKDVIVTLREMAKAPQTASEALAIATEYMNQFLNVGETDAKKKALKPDTTIYTLRSEMLAFENANKEKIDTNQFMVQVTEVSKSYDESTKTGIIIVQYSIVDRKTLSSVASSGRKLLKDSE